MRAVVQRVLSARVEVDGQVVGRIGPGLLVYAGSARGDTDADIAYIADKVANVRIFEDDAGKINRSVKDVAGAVLAVSAFTTVADARHGRRPGFDPAAPPDIARPMFERFVAAMAAQGVPVQTGIFQASMRVTSENDGPICLLLDSTRLF